jgi:hypothetical protein
MGGARSGQIPRRPAGWGNHSQRSQRCWLWIGIPASRLERNAEVKDRGSGPVSLGLHTACCAADP